VRKWLTILLLFLPAASVAQVLQITAVTAQVKDANGALYSNCQWSVVFVGQNTQPVGPYQPQSLLVGQQGTCDSFGNLNVNLVDNIVSVTPTPSQWQFNICSAAGYLGGPFCFQTLQTVTGVTQNFTSTFQPLAPLLPTSGGGTAIPGGATTQVQYNNSATFGGAATLTYNKSSNPPEIDVGSLENIQYIFPSYNWSQIPGGTLTGGTPATVTLTPCPYGVNGVVDTIGNMYIQGGTGTAEVVYFTGGGTCTSGAASGTVNFTPQNAHSGAWQIGSASSGIYEAMSGVANWGHPAGNARVVLRPAGFPNGASNGNSAYAYDIWGTVNTPINNVTLDTHGAVFNCHTRDYCVASSAALGPVRVIGARFASSIAVNGWAIASTQCASNVATITTTATHGVLVGDTVDVQWTDDHHYWGGSASRVSKVSAVTGTTISYIDTNCGGSGSIALATTPGYVNVVNAFFLAANNGDEIVDVINSNPGGPAGIVGHFNNGVVVLNDQAFKMDGTTINLSGGATTPECTTTNPYCGWGVYAPGPFVNAAVIWIVQSNLSMNCNGNGVGYFAGNTMAISNTVIQGFNEIGVYTGVVRGGFGKTVTSNVYQESGACANPKYVGSIGGATGYMNVGAPMYLNGGEGPNFSIPVFAVGGATQYYWYLIVHDSVLGASVPLELGSATPSTSTVTVQFPRVPGTNTITYDVIRTTTNVTSPYTGNCAGGSTSACGSVLLAAAQCGTLTCSFTDDVTVNTTSYSFTDPPTYIPFLWFWPAGMFSEPSGTDGLFGNTMDCGGRFHISNWSITIAASSNVGSYVPCAFIDYSPSGTFGNQEWISNLESQTGVATVLNTNLFTASNRKGRIVFSRRTGSTVPAGEILTLVDNSPAATFADGNKHPATDPLDMYIGNDIDSSALGATGMSLNAPVKITNYIGGTRSEQLSSTKKEFFVPAQFDQAINVLSGCTGCSALGLGGTQVSGFSNGNFTQVNGTITLNGTTAVSTTLGTGSESQIAYTASAFNNNQFTQATVQLTGGVMGVVVHQSSSLRTGYSYESNGGTSLIVKDLNGTLTSLISGLPQVFAGDILKITVYTSYSGSTASVVICAYQNGTNVTCVTDSSSPILSGSPGIYFANTTGQTFTNFLAGDLTYTSTAGILFGNLYGLTNALEFVFNPLLSPASGFNTGAITFNNGTAEVVVTVGTGAANSTGALALPTAKNGWDCSAQNQTRADYITQSANTTTSSTLQNWGTGFAATNWTNSDIILIKCGAF
jgi:hypothetical protein